MTLVDLIVNRGADFVKELPDNIRKDKEAAAEVIENNVRRLIVEEKPTNPKYYGKDVSAFRRSNQAKKSGSNIV